MKPKLQRIGILTGGGDCPGLNAVIRSITKPALSYYHSNVVGILDGFEGLVEGSKRDLTWLDVSGIIGLGGTILGTSNKGDPFRYPVGKGDSVRIEDRSAQAMKNYRDWGLDVLFAIGGDGTMHIARKFFRMGMNVIGIPKTIDNDLDATDVTFGYDTALQICTDAIDRLHTTASSHHRIIVIEVMGRYAGWIALGAGLSGGADIILIPEIPFRWDCIYRRVKERSLGARFSIICVAEGAMPEDGAAVIKEHDPTRTDPVRLGGIGDVVAHHITENTGLETRVTVLGHLQRGGSPTAYDRILASKFGVMALEAASRGEYGCMVSLRGSGVTTVGLDDAVKSRKVVSSGSQLITSARATGIMFGDC
ncbi:MAG TPA: ATP-dependent 6-phosphofructokinase [Bacteroidota bacterium]|nr:ATP-dependent 6-phosphofructokinase [Bacteroidota bacterium]